MSLPSRSQWQKFRDSHKDSPGKGAVASVSIGKVLDDTNKAATNKDFKKVAAGYQKAVKSFSTYHDKVKKKHPSFAKDFKKTYLDEAESNFASATAIAKPKDALKGNIGKIPPLIGAMNPSSTKNDFSSLHNSDPVRLIAMNLAMIVKAEPKLSSSVTPILNKWKGEMNKCLPGNVGDTPDEIAKAVLVLRKAVVQLVKDCKAANLV
ncbi:MAG: hypothetical protein AAFU49_08255 [Pseudomonadota bacterium]